MEKINLGGKPVNILQKIILWVFWVFHPKDDRKTWEETKHGAIKHECKFGEPIYTYKGCYYRKCIHYGCTMVDPD